jgi:ethanolamine utilization protein EutN
MRIARVIGSVTLSRCHPSLAGVRLPLVVPMSLENLHGTSDAEAEAMVVYDDLGAGVGSRIAITEGGEAVQPFYPEVKPVDAYNAAILDHIDV